MSGFNVRYRGVSGVGSSSVWSLKQGPRDPRHKSDDPPGTIASTPRLSQWHQRQGSHNSINAKALTVASTPRLSQRHQQHSATRLAPRTYPRLIQRLIAGSHPRLFVFLKPLLYIFLLPPNRSGLLRERSCSMRYIFSNTAGGIGTAQLRHV